MLWGLRSKGLTAVYESHWFVLWLRYSLHVNWEPTGTSAEDRKDIRTWKLGGSPTLHGTMLLDATLPAFTSINYWSSLNCDFFGEVSWLRDKQPCCFIPLYRHLIFTRNFHSWKASRAFLYHLGIQFSNKYSVKGYLGHGDSQRPRHVQLASISGEWDVFWALELPGI